MLIIAYSNNTDISTHYLTLHSPVNILNSLVYILQDIMHIHTNFRHIHICIHEGRLDKYICI